MGAGLVKEAEVKKKPALFITEIRIIEGAIFVHDLVPTAILTKGILSRFGDLARNSTMCLKVLVAIEVDLGDEILLIELQCALKMAFSLLELLLLLHLDAPIIARAGVETA